MKSRWEHLRSKAISLRRQGSSIRDIEMSLGIPRSTLSGWFRGVELTEVQKIHIKQQWLKRLVHSREKASDWHRNDKERRIEELKKAADLMLEQVSHLDQNTLEIALAFLYLGEGAKTNKTSMGSSDPRILRFFIYCMQTIYRVELERIKCSLHLRADQTEDEIKQYWSEELGIPLSNFTKSSFDHRTKGRPTYPNYKGVCLVDCGRVDIQRRLLYIADTFCHRIQDGIMRA